MQLCLAATFPAVTKADGKEESPVLNLSGLDLQSSTAAWMLIGMFSETVQFVMNIFRT